MEKNWNKYKRIEAVMLNVLAMILSFLFMPFDSLKLLLHGLCLYIWISLLQTKW